HRGRRTARRMDASHVDGALEGLDMGRLAPRFVLVARLTTAGCFQKLSGATCVSTTSDVASTSGDTVTTTRGLRFIQGDSGTGNGTQWCHAVWVNYAGYLLDGTKFDSSIDIGRPLLCTAGVGSLIDGIEQGVIGMRSCATRRLIIPPDLAFGANAIKNDSGRVIIQPNSTV